MLKFGVNDQYHKLVLSVELDADARHSNAKLGTSTREMLRKNVNWKTGKSSLRVWLVNPIKIPTFNLNELFRYSPFMCGFIYKSSKNSVKTVRLL